MRRLALLLSFFLAVSLSFGVIHLNIDGYSANNAPSPLDIESYVSGSNEIVHPDVVYFENAWNGYEYWMVFTPFPDSDAQYENPSIVASHDGLLWELPIGLTNPIMTPFPESYNPDNYYHSDPDIIMSDDNSTMYVFWREHSGWRFETFNYVSSTDGINWSSNQGVFYVDGNIERILSPAIVRDSINYKLWTVDTKTSPRTIRMRSSNSLTSGWSQPIATDLGLINGNSEVWHLDVTYIEGKYYMLASVGAIGSPRGGNLYLAVSDNGINWDIAENPALEGASNSWDELIYRSTILVSPIDNYLNFKVWYSSDGGTATDNNYWRIGYTEFSHDDIPDEETLPVLLANFGAVNTFGSTVRIQWITESEIDLDGYRLFRNNNNSIANSEMLDVFFSGTNTSHTQYYTYNDDTITSPGLYYYWLQIINYDGSHIFYGPAMLEVDEDNFNQAANVPLITGFTSIYPNPSNPTTTISYSLEFNSPVIINIYNIKGQLVKSFNEGLQVRGFHKVVWNGQNDSGNNLPSGIYLSTIKTKDKIDIMKIMLLK